jgi:predicted DNA-binding transcriptional regulator AlpA
VNLLKNQPTQKELQKMKHLKEIPCATQHMPQAGAQYPELWVIALRCWESNNLSVSPVTQVSQALSQGTSSVWAGVKAGTLPPPISITGTSSKRWLNNELDAIIAARTFESRTGQRVDMVAFVSLLIGGAKSKLARVPSDSNSQI